MKTKSFLILLFISFIAISSYFYLSYFKQKDIIYLTETVKRQDLQRSVIATGTIRAYNRVEVGAQVSGKIEKMHVTLGQEIQRGDLIAEIDSTTQLNHLNTAQAQLASYQAQFKAKQIAYDIAKSAHNRIANLYAKKSASLDELNNAQNTFAIAEAEIQAIQASIKQAEIDVNNAKTNLAYTKILSPISGTIISIPVSEGQTVNANQTTPTIVQVANLQKLLIKLEISEGDISKVRSGMKVKFSTLAEPDTFYQGVISSVDPAPTTLTDNEYSESISDTKAIYYYANVIIDNQDQKLRLGMTTQNTISITEVKNALVVPSITLQKQNHAYFANVLNNDNQVEAREVEIGLNDDTYSEILSGLKEGEKVISSQLENGEKVGNTRKPRMF